MGGFWVRAKVRTKIGACALAGVYVFAFLLLNSGQRVDLWVLPYRRYAISVPLLVFLTLLIAVLGTLLVRTTYEAARQIRQMRQRARAQRMEREMAEMKAKAAMLQTRPQPPPQAPSEQSP